MIGFGNHCSKIDGFLGTYGTHANGANVYAQTFLRLFDLYIGHRLKTTLNHTSSYLRCPWLTLSIATGHNVNNQKRME